MVTALVPFRTPSTATPQVTTENMVSPHGGFKGHGSPEGVIPARIGQKYVDLDNGDEWVKMEDDLGKTGWEVSSQSTDIRDFGVEPDSSLEQTSQLQEAFDAASAGGFTLYMPAGIYYTNVITLTGTLKIRGASRFKTIIRAKDSLNSTGGLINISTSGTQVEFEDLMIDGANKTLRIVRVNPSVDCAFYRCEIQNAFGDSAAVTTTCGLLVNGAGRFKFINSRVKGIVATANGVTGDDVGCSRGISLAMSGASEAPPLEALISGSTIEDVYSVGVDDLEDSDGIAYQSWGQDTKGNVKILGCHFINVTKRWVKALSPGGIIANCDGTNSRTSASPMYSAFSIYSSDWKVISNRAEDGARSYGIDAGTTDWPCNNIELIGNNLGQGSDPKVLAEGIKVFGSTSGSLTTGVAITGNNITEMFLGVHVAGGVVGCRITGNYAQVAGASSVAYLIGSQYLVEQSYPLSLYVTCGENVFNSAAYGVRWKDALHCTPGINAGTAVTPFQADGVYTAQFDDVSLYRLNMIGGYLKGASVVIVGATTAQTFGSVTPTIQARSLTPGATVGIMVDVQDDTPVTPRNTRAMLFYDDTTFKWGLDSTYSSGGVKTFVIAQAGTTWLSIDGTKIVPSLSIIPLSGSIDIGSTASYFRGGYFYESMNVGHQGFATGTLVLGHATGANATSIRAAASAAAALTYVWPADSPTAGESIKCLSNSAGVVTLEWA